MFVTVSTYRAKAGEEDAIIAYEHWHQNQQAKTIGYLSVELLWNSKDPRQFIVIMRFRVRNRFTHLQITLSKRHGTSAS